MVHEDLFPKKPWFEGLDLDIQHDVERRFTERDALAISMDVHYVHLALYCIT
jgi:hypothetical protein